MRGESRAVNLWLDPNFTPPEAIYLDGQCYKLYLDWLRADPRRVQELFIRGVHVVLFTQQLHEVFDQNPDRNQELRGVGLEFRPIRLRQQDNPLLTEALRAYFHNDANARAQAILYVLARREAGSNSRLSILSQHRGFSRIPTVDTYYFPDAPLDGPNDLPAQFDFLQDFRIHRELRQAVQHRIDVVPYDDTMFTAIVALRDHIRQLSGLGEDGHSLMERAFGRSGDHIRLNPLTDPDPRGSQQNEQRGFQELYCGMWTGLRNPLFHEGPGSSFARARYPDKKTLLKYLSFLSILFERADGPLP